VRAERSVIGTRSSYSSCVAEDVLCRARGDKDNDKKEKRKEIEINNVT
jgi:hypothetical protein